MLIKKYDFWCFQGFKYTIYPGNASGMLLKSGIHGQPSPNWPGIFKIVGPSPVRDFQDIFVLVHFSPRFSNSSWLWSSPRFLIFFDSGSSRTYFNRFRSTDPLLGIKADYPWNFAINRDQIVLKLLFSVEIKSSPGSKWWQQFQVIEGMKLNIGFDNVII